jgi:hypothetical protein
MRTVSSSIIRPRLSLAEREQAAADARGSVLAEGLDPSRADGDLGEWVRGEIDSDELVRRGLGDAAARYGQPRPPSLAG